MRTLVEWTFVSLDGVIDSADWARPYLDDEHHRYAVALLDETDALLLGRKTYEGLRDFWPKQTGEIADRINSRPNYVASRTLPPGEADWNTTILTGDVRRGRRQAEGRARGQRPQVRHRGARQEADRARARGRVLLREGAGRCWRGRAAVRGSRGDLRAARDDDAPKWDRRAQMRCQKRANAGPRLIARPRCDSIAAHERGRSSPGARYAVVPLARGSCCSRLPSSRSPPGWWRITRRGRRATSASSSAIRST